MTEGCYDFRIRSYKTNEARGTTYSQYSKWFRLGPVGLKPYDPSTFENPYTYVDRMNAAGYRYACESFAYSYTGFSMYEWEKVSTPQFGDIIIHYKSGVDNTGRYGYAMVFGPEYSHMSVYIGNGMALHGNYTSDHQARIASAKLYSYQEYYRPKWADE